MNAHICRICSSPAGPLPSHHLIVDSADAEDMRRTPSRSPFEAHCSCQLWKAGTDTRKEYRDLHQRHLDEVQGALELAS